MSSPTSLQKKQEDQGGVSPKAASDSSTSGKSERIRDVSSVENSSAAGSNEGETTMRVATVEPVPRRLKNVGNAGLVSRAETLDDGPPNMEALHPDFPKDDGEPSGAVTGGSCAGEEVIMVGKGGIPVKSTSWLKSTEETTVTYTGEAAI